MLRLLYEGAMTLAQTASWVTPPLSSKVARSLVARRRVLSRWTAAAATRDPSRPLVWLHAPSVGEGLQARPIAHALRAARPDLQLAYSYFSPSAEKFARSIGADFTDYLPFDRAASADRLLSALRPDVLVFVKLDVWPTLVARAVARGVPVALVSATLAEGSGRRGGLSRTLLQPAYAALRAVGAIDAIHARRLLELGVSEEGLQLTGDTRYDQVWDRAWAVRRPAPILAKLESARPTVVAGSTWPADEAVLLPAWRFVRTRLPDARLIIAPHEPTSDAVDRIRQWGVKSGMAVQTLTDVERVGQVSADVLVVDRIGLLGDLYRVASAAFVGGGFHSAGLHSVIEPAAFGVPVTFGPRHQMSRDAGLLIAEGGGKSVEDADALSRVLSGWLRDANIRDAAGGAAKYVVENGRGATQKTTEMILQLLQR